MGLEALDAHVGAIREEAFERIRGLVLLPGIGGEIVDARELN